MEDETCGFTYKLAKVKYSRSEHVLGLLHRYSLSWFFWSVHLSKAWAEDGIQFIVSFLFRPFLFRVLYQNPCK